MVKKDFLRLVLSGAALMLLSACNGILGGIYDEPADETNSGYGFITEPTETLPGTIYIDATDYSRWTYIDFHRHTFDALSVDDPEPATWDIAIHRYDVKTNGGKAAETGASTLPAMTTMPAESDFVADVWTTETIITDVSSMMDGYVSYAESFYNPEISKWLNVDKSTMPPVYTPSNKVYVVRFADGTYAALLFSNYTDSAGTKGYLTIQYKYPLSI